MDLWWDVRPFHRKEHTADATNLAKSFYGCETLSPGKSIVIASLNEHIVQLFSKHLCLHQYNSQPLRTPPPFLHRMTVNAAMWILSKYKWWIYHLCPSLPQIQSPGNITGERVQRTQAPAMGKGVTAWVHSDKSLLLQSWTPGCYGNFIRLDTATSLCGQLGAMRSNPFLRR